MRSTSRIKSGSPGFVLWSEFTSDSIHSTQLAQLYPHSQHFHHLFVVIQNPGKNALVILQRILACLTTHPSTNDFAQTTRLQVSSNYHIVAEKNKSQRWVSGQFLNMSQLTEAKSHWNLNLEAQCRNGNHGTPHPISETARVCVCKTRSFSGICLDINKRT